MLDVLLMLLWVDLIAKFFYAWGLVNPLHCTLRGRHHLPDPHTWFVSSHQSPLDVNTRSEHFTMKLHVLSWRRATFHVHVAHVVMHFRLWWKGRVIRLLQRAWSCWEKKWRNWKKNWRSQEMVRIHVHVHMPIMFSVSIVFIFCPQERLYKNCRL